MRLARIEWKNYRRLNCGGVDVRNHLILVGPNDVGKSSILRAINLCLGISQSQLASSISLRDFTDPSEALVVRVVLASLNDDQRAVFPDEINLEPEEHLVIEVEASIDPTDPESRTVRRTFPGSGHQRPPTRQQLETIGFHYIPATRSLYRELGGGAGGAMKALLAGIDLGDDASSIAEAVAGLRSALEDAGALKAFREDLATSLSDALPSQVEASAVRVVSESDLLQDPLGGVTVTLAEGAYDAPLTEQSDGIRALSALTLLSMARRDAMIVAIDEPETHLHPLAQRSVIRNLSSSGGQRIFATHSPSVVAAVEPRDLVVVRSNRSVKQLPPGSSLERSEMIVRHWSNRLIEPLTARTVVIVEGPSDQILVERVAELRGMSLDRMGVAIFNLDGAELFRKAYEVYGPCGFDIPIVGMVDEDHRIAWAAAVGVPAAELEGSGRGFAVCEPDLEAEYVAALGRDFVVAAIAASPLMGEASLLRSTGASSVETLSPQMIREYCGHKKRKVLAALAVGQALDTDSAAKLTPIVSLLDRVAAA